MFSFQMIFFLSCDHDLDFDIILFENLINQPIKQSVRDSFAMGLHIEVSQEKFVITDCGTFNIPTLYQ